MKAAGPPVGPQRLAALDGLRALAVAAVVAVHANVLFGGETAAGTVTTVAVARLFGAGWAGVDLFFCLSGFLITRILWRTRAGRNYYGNFYARRLLRIAPLYYGFVGLVLVVVYRLSPIAHAAPGGGIASLLLSANNFHYAATATAVPHLGHFWSLAVEEHFYLLWPLAVRCLGRRRLMQLCLVGAGASMLLRLAVVTGGGWQFSAYLLTPCRLDGLLLGSLVALAAEDSPDLARLGRWLRWALVPAGAAIAAVVLLRGEFTARPAGADLRLSIGVGIGALSLLSAAAVAGAVSGAGRWSRLLEHRWLGAVGRRSYCIYVCHCLAVSALKWLVEARLGGLPQVPQAAGKVAAFLVVGAVSLASAWLSYHLLEKHFLRLQCHFTYEGTGADGASASGVAPIGDAAARRAPPVSGEWAGC